MLKAAGTHQQGYGDGRDVGSGVPICPFPCDHPISSFAPVSFLRYYLHLGVEAAS